MNCLSAQEISTWLRENCQIEDPYLGESQPTFRVQCEAPGPFSALQAFVSVILNQIATHGGVLIQATDSFSAEEGPGLVIESIRRHAGEERPLEGAPGFLFGRSEIQYAVTIFALLAAFKWKSYAYAEHDQITLYNWEGEIFDLWTASAAKREEFKSVLKNFNLRELPNKTAGGR
jgi:hypothetical protein